MYDSQATDYLSRKDPKMGEVIARVGKIEREVDTDLFSAVVHHIVAQQISTKAQATVWQRMKSSLGEINADTVLARGADGLQSIGISFRKAEYITDFAKKVKQGTFDTDGIYKKSDAEVISELTALRGVGIWTAEMLLLFCMGRPNVFSFGDFGILKGLRMLYHHRKIDRPLFEKYKRRFTPFCSVASLYLWAIAGGAIPEISDCESKQKNSKKTNSKSDKLTRPGLSKTVRKEKT